MGRSQHRQPDRSQTRRFTSLTRQAAPSEWSRRESKAAKAIAVPVIARARCPRGSTRAKGEAAMKYLLGATFAGFIVSWWGTYVVPSLLRIAFPAVIPTIPVWLNADANGSLPNYISAAVLATASIALFVCAVRTHRGSYLATIGWSFLAVTTLFVLIAELTDWHNLLLDSWSIQPAPLAAVFVVLVLLFLWRVDHPFDVRLLLGLGCILWTLVIVHEAIQPYAKSRFGFLPIVIEETMEIKGALSLSAAAWLTHKRPSALPSWGTSAAWSTLVVSVCSVIVIFFLYQVPLTSTRYATPLISTRDTSPLGTFHVVLEGYGAVQQDLRPIPFPSDRIDVRMGLRGEMPTSVDLRVLADTTVISAGRAHVLPQATGVSMQTFVLAPVLDPISDSLSIQLITDLPVNSTLRIGAIQGNLDDGLRLQTNGDVQPPGHRIEYTVYSTAEPTRAKLSSLWHIASDWRHVATAVFCWVSLIPLVFIPLLLIRLALAAPAGRSHVRS